MVQTGVSSAAACFLGKPGCRLLRQVAAFGSVAAMVLPVDAAEPATTPAADAIHLDWTAPPECPSAEQVQQDVRRIMGAPPSQAEKLEAVGVVSRSQTGQWRVELGTRMGGIEGRRSLAGADCAEVSHAAALVLALMLRPLVPEPAAEPVSSPAQRSSPSVLAAPPPERSEDAPWLVRAAFLAGVGTLPGLEVGYGLHIGLAAEPVLLELRMVLWLPKTAHTNDLPGAGGKFWLGELASAACLRAGQGWFRTDSCAGPRLLQMQADGFGVTDPGQATARWGGAFLEQAAVATLTSRARVRASAQLLWPFSRPAFAIENVGEIHRPAPLAARTALAFELSF
jgi:hypothetical protein